MRLTYISFIVGKNTLLPISISLYYYLYAPTGLLLLSNIVVLSTVVLALFPAYRRTCIVCDVPSYLYCTVANISYLLLFYYCSVTAQ
jgi:hypothetical protein